MVLAGGTTSRYDPSTTHIAWSLPDSNAKPGNSIQIIKKKASTGLWEDIVDGTAYQILSVVESSDWKNHIRMALAELPNP